MKSITTIAIFLMSPWTFAGYRACLPQSEITQKIPQIKCLLTDHKFSSHDLTVSIEVFDTTQSPTSKNICKPGSLNHKFAIQTDHDYILLALPDDDVPVQNGPNFKLHAATFSLVGDEYSYSLNQWTSGEPFFGDISASSHDDKTYQLRIRANLTSGDGQLSYQVTRQGQAPMGVVTKALHSCVLQ